MVRDLLISSSNLIPESLMHFALVRYLYWILRLCSFIPFFTSTLEYISQPQIPITFFFSWGWVSQVVYLSCSDKCCIPLITIIAVSYTCSFIMLIFLENRWPELYVAFWTRFESVPCKMKLVLTWLCLKHCIIFSRISQSSFTI